MNNAIKKMVSPFMKACKEEKPWWTKVGYFFAFLGSGTDCQCCHGTRVIVALIYGAVSGLSALISKYLAIGLIIGVLFALLTVFAVQTMIEIEENGETDS